MSPQNNLQTVLHVTSEGLQRMVANTAELPRPGGTLTVDSALYREWDAMARTTSPAGDSVQAELGWPLEDVTAPDGSTVVMYERGMIVLRPDGRVFTSYGPVYVRYLQLVGDIRHPSGLFYPGLPTSEQTLAPGGAVQTFDNGLITWSQSRTQAFEAHGLILAKWQALGGPGGFLGYPLSDETQVLLNGAEIGRFNLFDGGTIYWKDGAAEAFEVHGMIRGAYSSSANGPCGRLGFPISDEGDSPQGSKRVSSFEQGCLTWDKSSGVIKEFTQVDLELSNINGSGSHTFFESIGAASVWLYVNVHIGCAPQGTDQSFRLPPNGDYGSPSAAPGQVATVGPVCGDETITVSLDGWDKCNSRSDVHLGTCTVTFNADNDFGVNQPQHLDSSDMHADVSMTQMAIDNPNDPNFRSDFFWDLVNIGTDTLTVQQYAETFRDVGANESDLHIWDHAFYDLIFKHIARGGNCFGMCVESIFAELGNSLFSEPIFSVTPWSKAVNAFNIKQAYQVGAEFLDFFAIQVLADTMWNPIAVFNAARAAFECGDYPVICLTPANLSEGHCIRPCGPNAFTETPTQLIMNCANPNNPGSVDGDPQNTVYIDKATNTYTFHFDGGAPWTGGHHSGGLLSWVPYSVLSCEPRTPFAEAITAALGVALIFASSNVDPKQITDDRGRTYYKAGLNQAPSSWDEVAGDIPGLVRVPVHQRQMSVPMVAAQGLAINPNLLAAQPTGQAQIYAIKGLPSPYGPSPKTQPATAIGLNEMAPTHITLGGPARTTTMAAQQPVAAPTVASARQEVATAAMDSAPPTTLVLDLMSTSSDDYSWAIGTHVAILAGSIGGHPSAEDQITLSGLDTPEPEAAVKVSSTSGPRSVSMVLAPKGAGRPTQAFQIGPTNLIAGEGFVAGVKSDGNSLEITATTPLQFDLTLAGPDGTAVTKQVTLAGGGTAAISPASWTGLANAPVQMNVLDRPGGTVIQSIHL